jgi:hypothetical protein
MAHVTISEDALRQMLKQAVAEALDERRDLLHDVIAEVLEDFALAEAVREGQQTERASRDEVFAELDGTS